MKKILFLLLMLVLLLNSISAEINEKAFEKNVKQSLFKKLLEKVGVTTKVSEEINKTNPQVIENLNKVCKKTSGWIILITILSILTALGLISFKPVGIGAGLIDLLVFINPFCWFSI